MCSLNKPNAPAQTTLITQNPVHTVWLQTQIKTSYSFLKDTALKRLVHLKPSFFSRKEIKVYVK